MFGIGHHNNYVHFALASDVVGVIDLEYAGPNYMAYEIADHFCEFAGVHDVNFDLYPNEDVQKVWIKAYLEEANGETEMHSMSGHGVAIMHTVSHSHLSQVTRL